MAPLKKEWMVMQHLRLEKLGASIQQFGSTELKVRFGQYTLEVMLPGGLVMVMEGMDERLQDMINDLNDRISSQGKGPDLHKVLDHLLDTLESFKRKKLGTVKTICQGKQVEAYVIEDDEGENLDMEIDENDDMESAEDEKSDADDDGNDEDYYGEGYQGDNMFKTCSKEPGSLYSLVAEALARCAEYSSSSIKSVENIELFYKYCTVTEPARSGTWVRLEIDFASLLNGSPVTESLGLEGTLPTVITLDVDNRSWNLVPFTKANLEPGQAQVQHRNFGQQREYGHLQTEYGARILITTLIDMFISFCSSGQRSVSTMNEDMFKALRWAANIRNPILGLIYFLTSQVWTLPAWCPLCCSLLPVRPYKLLSCQADKCMFEFQEQGLASCALAHVKKTPKVVELELTLLYAAATATHRDVLEPFPSFLLKRRELRQQNGWFGGVAENSRYTTSTVRGEDVSQNKMNSLIAEVVANMPTSKEMGKCESEAELHKYMSNELSKKIQEKVVHPPDTMENSHRLSYKLLSYCLSSNRISVQLLEGEDRLLASESIVQFVVLHDTPEKEAIRKQLPKGHPSFFAFHGSNIGNWYSILRNGIRSMSQTKYMSAGAAYGNGIYCSPQLRVSLGYSKQSNYTQGNREFAGYTCVAIVQIFHDVPNHNDYCYVIPKEYEDRVLLRYLLLFPAGVSEDSTTISGSTLKGASKQVDLAKRVNLCL